MNSNQESINATDAERQAGSVIDFSGFVLDASLLDAREEAVEDAATESHILGEKIRAWRTGL